MADLNPRSLVRKHLLDPLDLDDLEATGPSRASTGHGRRDRVRIASPSAPQRLESPVRVS
jgi:hypothetical protein